MITQIKQLHLQTPMSESDDAADRRWACLPAELLQIIGKNLDSRVDVFRFRAVCTSWRSSVPPSFKQSNLIPFKLPRPIPAEAVLSPVTFCRIEFVTGDDSASMNPACLTKVEQSINGEIQLLIPLSNRHIRLSPGMNPKTLNSLNFRLVELSKGCNFKLVNGRPVLGINKVVSFSIENSFLSIFYEGKLGFWRIGDENWTLLDELNFNYDDIIVYRGQFYVVDRTGTVFWIDSSLNLIQYSPPLYGCGDRKNMVESGGDLYIVDRYFDGERRIWEDREVELYNQMLVNQSFRVRNLPKCRAKSVDVKVYKLDEEWGTWVDVKYLGDDRVFVIGNECCFSVYVDKFGGNYEGNCVYFTDPYDEEVSDGISGFDARVFRLADRSIVRATSFHGFSQIMWPIASSSLTVSSS